MHGRLGEASDTGQAFIDDILTAIEKGKTALGTYILCDCVCGCV